MQLTVVDVVSEDGPSASLALRHLLPTTAQPVAERHKSRVWQKAGLPYQTAAEQQRTAHYNEVQAEASWHLQTNPLHDVFAVARCKNGPRQKNIYYYLGLEEAVY